jgi:hypothetical protein
MPIISKLKGRLSKARKKLELIGASVMAIFRIDLKTASTFENCFDGDDYGFR